MSKSVQELSVADLERLLRERRVRLERLLKRKSRLEKELSEINDQISSLQGAGTLPGGLRKGVRRPRNAKPLHRVVLEILAGNKKGYGLSELAERVLATGYKTSSSDFKNVLYQCLYNSPQIEHEEATGKYRAKPG